jgi:predicted SAM-dependent methyltransferase
MKQNMDELRRLPPELPEGIRRVQVGCGPHHLRREWWNTDLRTFPGIDQAMDATRPWRWRDRLDYVYGEHFIEHLQIDQSVAFLVAAGTALRVGGRIRLTTPSLEWVMKTHFSFRPADEGAHFDEAMNVNRGFYGWGHRFLYTRGVLERLMREIGYHDVRFFPYGQSDTPDLVGLEMHETGPDAEGYPSQWVVEGERGRLAPRAPEALINELDSKLLDAVRGGH